MSLGFGCLAVIVGVVGVEQVTRVVDEPANLLARFLFQSITVLDHLLVPVQIVIALGVALRGRRVALYALTFRSDDRLLVAVLLLSIEILDVRFDAEEAVRFRLTNAGRLADLLQFVRRWFSLSAIFA